MQVGKIPGITTVAEGVAVAYLHRPNRVWGSVGGSQRVTKRQVSGLIPPRNCEEEENRAVPGQRGPASGKRELNILIGWQSVRTQEFLVF